MPVTPPSAFGGWQDLICLPDGSYAAGTGMGTTPVALDWIVQRYGLEVIRIPLVDPDLDTLDNLLLPLTVEQTLICTDLLEDADIASIESRTGIIDVPIDLAYAGICNSLRLNGEIFNGTVIGELRQNAPDYTAERDKIDLLTRICDGHGLRPRFF